MALPGTNEVIRGFDRDTKWLAMRVLAALIFAALMCAVLVQGRHPQAANLPEEARKIRGDLSPNAAALSEVLGLNGKSTSEITSGQATSVDHGFTEISPQENPSSQMEAAASTPTPVLAFTSEINRPDVQANAESWTAAHRQDSGRVMGLKAHRARSRSSVRLRFVDVKTRLIALWHQSLAESKKARTWTALSNSNKGERSKVSYTAETYY